MAGLDPVFNEVLASTRYDIRDGVVYNNFWVDTPLQDHFRRSGAFDDFTGGVASLDPFIYQGPDGGGVDPGQTVTVMRRQILASLSFQPKAYATWFSVEDFEMGNGEHAGVINAGPNAAVDLYTVYLEGLTSRLNTFIEMDFYRHGQASGGTVTDNRVKLIDGASEACNDGYNPSWDSNVFSTYGTQPRNGAVSNALNSIPRWAGDASGNPGQISFDFMIQTYLQAIERPTIGITSKVGYGYICSLYQRQQRYDISVTKRDGNIRWNGLTFEDAVIYDDWLTPSAVEPSYLPTGLVGGGGQTNVTSTFSVPATVTSASGLPASGTTVTVGETLWWFYAPSWRFRPTNNPAWFFGIRRTSAYDNVSLDALFMRLALNVECPMPRCNVQCYGFNS
jgi:hypothetical protein